MSIHNTHSKVKSPLRVISYNILGDGVKLALSAKHDYCPYDLRLWNKRKNGLPGRWTRLFEEMTSYKADVYCLQEVQLKKLENMKNDFHQSQYETIHALHSLSKTDESLLRRRDSPMGPAMIVASSYQVLHKKSYLLRSFISKLRFSGKSRKKLMSLDDLILVTLLRRTNSNDEAVVATTHLHWDPRYPHVKACQAEFACMAIHDFCRIHNININDTPIIFTGDFNSLPYIQPEFFPENQKKWVNDLQKTGDKLPTGFNNSGVYQLLHHGELVPGHPEHPDSFGQQQPSSMDDQKKKENKKQKKCGPLKSELQLKSVYEIARNGKPLTLTTKTDDFEGGIDYMLTTLKNERVIEILSLPYQDGEESKFSLLPSDHYPSDHLAIGATFELFS